ncbi:unnamed protein product, partial [Iphiclides podalirius]
MQANRKILVSILYRIPKLNIVQRLSCGWDNSKTRTATKQRWLGLKLCDEPADEDVGMEEPGATKRPSVLTIDRAAFLLLRVKRAFKKKRQQRKEKQ